VVRGPLTDIANKVAIVYSSVDTSINPPAMGMRVKANYAEDADSQADYGIITKVLSVGGSTQTIAEQIRDTWLAENAWPETSHTYGQGGGDASVTVECLGYVKWLELFPYNQTANTGTRNLSDKITDVLAAEPNTLFSTDYTNIASNTLAVRRFENDDNSGWDVIKDLVAKGDTSDNRYLFGIYDDRVAHYEQIPEDTAYHQYIADSNQNVRTPVGDIVRPWDVRPGRWLLYPDFLVGRSIPTNRRLDSRFEFIESVTYSSPWTISHTGSKVATLPQKLAKLGLGGVG